MSLLLVLSPSFLTNIFETDGPRMPPAMLLAYFGLLRLLLFKPLVVSEMPIVIPMDGFARDFHSAIAQIVSNHIHSFTTGNFLIFLLQM